MPDREKVIKALEICSKLDNSDECPKECPYGEEEYTCGLVIMLQDMLELLKESVEPILALDDGEHKLWQCGNCKVAVFTRDTKYCHNCGKAVKWDDSD